MKFEASMRHQTQRLVQVTAHLIAGRAAEEEDGDWRSPARERAGSTA